MYLRRHALSPLFPASPVTESHSSEISDEFVRLKVRFACFPFQIHPPDKHIPRVVSKWLLPLVVPDIPENPRDASASDPLIHPSM
jgi:hypothetical protein